MFLKGSEGEAKMREAGRPIPEVPCPGCYEYPVPS